MKAWECIGCGNLDAARTCIGVCEYRKVEFVYAHEHAEALDAARQARIQAEALLAVVTRLARTTPRNGEWQRGYVALQADALKALRSLRQEA